MRKFCAFLVISIHVLCAFGQQISARFEKLAFDTPFSQDLINCIWQDSKGYLWFGTEDGLHRFDGYSFKVFTHVPGDSTTISGNLILSITEDRSGRLWIGTEGTGLNVYDPHTETFDRINTHSSKANYRLFNDYVYALYHDSKDRIWVGTSLGIHLINSSRTDIRYILNDNTDFENPVNAVNTIAEDHTGDIWIGTHGGGLLKFDGTTLVPRHHFSSKTESQLSSDFIRTLEVSEDNKLYVGTRGGGVNVIDLVTSENIKIISSANTGLKTDHIRDILFDQDQHIWIATSNGLYELNKNWKLKEAYFHDKSEINSLSHNRVRCLWQDQGGLIWIGTYGRGINYINPNAKKFFGFPFLEDVSVWSVVESSQNTLWIGTMVGLFKYNKETGKYKLYKHQEHDPKSLIHNTVRSLYMDASEKLWVGTNRGISIYDEVADHFINYGEDRLCNRHVRAVQGDSLGNIWAATSDGLNKISSNGVVTCYENSGEGNQNVMRSLALDQHGNIWIGSYGAGLSKFSVETEEFQNFQHQPQNPNSLSNNYIWDILVADNQDIWLATDYGLNKYDQNNGAFTRITTSEGFSHNAIRGIVSSRKDELWVSTENGINHFSIPEGVLRKFDERDGLQGDQFNPGAYLDSNAGIYMWGIRGLNYFHPDSISSNRLKPFVHITSIEVANDELDPARRNSSEIILTHRQNAISFEFAALNFANPQKNHYRCILDGFEEEWVNLSNRRRRTYTNLEPGTYTFRVIASNDDGLWNEEATSFRFTINPPFWNTWWFRITAFTLVSSMVGFFFYYRLSQIRTRERIRAELNSKLAESKLTALRAQMNPHFIFNCLNSIQYFIASDDQESAFIYLSKFSSLIRQILENSRKFSVTLAEEIETLIYYIELESLRFEDRFSYDIKVDSKINPSQVNIPTMLVQPYVENAIIHGLMYKKEGGKLTVSFDKVDDKKILCVIQDDGAGRKAAAEIQKRKKKKYESMGTQITDSRLKMLEIRNNSVLNIEIKDLYDGAESKGTRVEILIPINNHFQEQ